MNKVFDENLTFVEECKQVRFEESDADIQNNDSESIEDTEKFEWPIQYHFQITGEIYAACLCNIICQDTILRAFNGIDLECFKFRLFFRHVPKRYKVRIMRKLIKCGRFAVLDVSREEPTVKNDDLSLNSCLLYSQIEKNLSIIDNCTETELISEPMAQELTWLIVSLNLLDDPTSLDNMSTDFYEYLCQYFCGFRRETVESALKILLHFYQDYQQKIGNSAKFTQKEFDRIRKEYFGYKSINFKLFYKYFTFKWELIKKLLNQAANVDAMEVDGVNENSSQVDKLTRNRWPCQDLLVSIDKHFLRMRNLIMWPGNLHNGVVNIAHKYRSSMVQEVHRWAWSSGTVILHHNWLWMSIWQMGLHLLKRQYFGNEENFLKGVDPDRREDQYAAKLFDFFDAVYLQSDRRRFFRSRCLHLMAETFILLSNEREIEKIDLFDNFSKLWVIIENPSLRVLAKDWSRYVIEVYMALGTYQQRSLYNRRTNLHNSTLCYDFQLAERKKLIEALIKYYSKIPNSARLLEIALKLVKSDKNLKKTYLSELERALIAYLSVEPQDTKAFELLVKYFPDNSRIFELLPFHMSHEFLPRVCQLLAEKLPENVENLAQILKIVIQFLDFASNKNHFDAWILLNSLIDRFCHVITLANGDNDSDGAPERLLDELWAERSDWWVAFHLPKRRPMHYLHSDDRGLRKLKKSAFRKLSRRSAANSARFA